MPATDRLKQVLMGIGLMTVLGMLAVGGLIAYLWWDTQDVTVENSPGADFDDDFDTADESDADSESDSEVTAE